MRMALPTNVASVRKTVIADIAKLTAYQPSTVSTLLKRNGNGYVFHGYNVSIHVN